ncbi:putative membrane protein [Clostridioides difficile 655]|nr:putative membrane protein [Clostridioides difficile 655]
MVTTALALLSGILHFLSTYICTGWLPEAKGVINYNKIP